MADFPNRWMWAEACEALERAERMHREFFRPVRSVSRAPAWEPPVDVLEPEPGQDRQADQQRKSDSSERSEIAARIE